MLADTFIGKATGSRPSLSWRTMGTQPSWTSSTWATFPSSCPICRPTTLSSSSTSTGATMTQWFFHKTLAWAYEVSFISVVSLQECMQILISRQLGPGRLGFGVKLSSAQFAWTPDFQACLAHLRALSTQLMAVIFRWRCIWFLRAQKRTCLWWPSSLRSTAPI